MTTEVETGHRAGGAPIGEGRRRFQNKTGGLRACAGAPVVEGRTAAPSDTPRKVACTADSGVAPGATDMEPFVVTFRFATAPIVRGGCTLDAVLGGEIARRMESREEAIRRTPLACTDGVHHGSSLLLLGDTGVARPVLVVQNNRAAFSGVDSVTIASVARRRVTLASAKNVLNRYEARVCEGGAWLGTGRIEEVFALLSSLLGIGKRRQSGWGMIDPGSLEVESVHADPRTWGLVTGPQAPDFASARIEPRRPLPLELFRRLGGDPLDELIAVVRVRQPYYDPANPPVPAVVPEP